MSSDRDETASSSQRSQVTGPTGPAEAMPVEELPRGTPIGRYLIVHRLGQGGMGVVYAAYDAELNRRVALKLLRPRALANESGDGHARLLREAQAMARVSHPNVIAIHDVGSFRDQVFMAMELVEGSTLDQWAKEKERPWAEVTRMLLDAGRGLAAAHAAGLVHRDFKPQNVLVGRDGRVFVTDFGLARMADTGDIETAQLPPALRELEARSKPSGQLTSDGVVLGTPRYMPPEQYLAGPVDARADQFSFCASFYWALWRTYPFDHTELARRARQLRAEGARTRPLLRGEPDDAIVREPPSQPRVPARLRRAVMRGLALDPEQRFPGMEPLLAEMGATLHPPSTQVALAAALLAGVLVVGGGAWAYRDRSRSQLCSGGSAEIGAVWNPGIAGAVKAAFTAVAPERGPEPSQLLVATLDGYAGRWAQAYREACETTRIRGEQTEATLSLRMICLERRRKDLGALVRLLERPDAALADRAVDAAQSLSAIGQCGDADTLAQMDRPEDPARRASLEKLEEQLARVSALRGFGRYPQGLEEARAAVAVSKALAFKPLQAQAHLELAWFQDLTGDQQSAELELYEALRLAEAGRDDVTKLRVASRLSYVTGYRVQDFKQGAQWSRYAQATLERLGADRYPELESDTNNVLGLVQMRAGDPRAAIAAFQRSLAAAERHSAGADMVRARALANIAVSRGVLGEYEEVVSSGRLAVTHLERLRGADHPLLVEPLGSVADALRQLGRLDEALPLANRALRLAETKLGREHPATADALDNRADVLLEQGHPREALIDAERALAVRRKGNGSMVAEAFSLNTIGRAQLQLGRLPEAIASLERAASLKPPNAAVMADIELGLARALAAAHRDPARAQALAGSARSRFEQLHHARRLAELDAWLAAHGARGRR